MGALDENEGERSFNMFRMWAGIRRTTMDLRGQEIFRRVNETLDRRAANLVTRSGYRQSKQPDDSPDILLCGCLLTSACHNDKCTDLSHENCTCKQAVPLRVRASVKRCIRKVFIALQGDGKQFVHCCSGRRVLFACKQGATPLMQPPQAAALLARGKSAVQICVRGDDCPVKRDYPLTSDTSWFPISHLVYMDILAERVWRLKKMKPYLKVGQLRKTQLFNGRVLVPLRALFKQAENRDTTRTVKRDRQEYRIRRGAELMLSRYAVPSPDIFDEAEALELEKRWETARADYEAIAPHNGQPLRAQRPKNTPCPRCGNLYVDEAAVRRHFKLNIEACLRASR
jgi:hypothetical protein